MASTIKHPKYFRDLDLAQRHLAYGDNCPCVDIDYLLVEYNHGIPVALIDYKYHLAPEPPPTGSASYKAMTTLCDSAGLPLFTAYYWRNPFAYRIYPVNRLARERISGEFKDMSEKTYIKWLYWLRGLSLAKEKIKINLSDMMPNEIDDEQ